MFEKIIESGKSGIKPISGLMTINAKAIEKLASQQSSFLTGCVSDGMKQAQELSSVRDIGTFMESQKNYAEGFQQRIIENAKQTLELMNEVRESATSLVETAITPSSDETTKKTATSKKSA